MTPLRWVTGGGDQENFTSLSPGTASNISGDPDGAEGIIIIIKLFHMGFTKYMDNAEKERECPKIAHLPQSSPSHNVYLCVQCVCIVKYQTHW